MSSYINKIISKVIHARIAKCLPDIISKNQSGFMKGRSITENVLLAQKIIRDINKRNKHHNLVVKLDMAKANDKSVVVVFNKSFQINGFLQRVIDMVWRLISNN